jgi:hypothetical protein
MQINYHQNQEDRVIQVLGSKEIYREEKLRGK